MTNASELFNLPLQNHVLIFALLLLIIFIVPYISEKIRLPSLVGLIIVGTVVGENGFNVLLRNSSIILFGTIGVLYIMFLAGLEIDLHDFKKYKFKSLVFGLLTFSIPMIVGTYANHYFLNLNWDSAILLASMYASHTLLAYPLASKLKITKNEAITVALGGTMITDTAALMVLAVIVKSVSGEINLNFWKDMAISSGLFFAFVLIVVPKLAYWFFRRFESGGSEQFLFVMALVFIGGATAEMAGIEPIIGAFFVGLAINPLIPHSSILMNRLEFVGNTLFIPFFLISVGMLIDITVFYNDFNAVKVALVMTSVAMLTKYAAAFFTSKIFNYSSTQRNLIFSLSNAQAAATLAAVLIGFRIGLLDKSILNGTILMILVTCVVSSLVMEKYGRRLARSESSLLPDKNVKDENVFVALNRSQLSNGQLDLAIYIKEDRSTSPIYIGTVVDEEDNLELNLKNARDLLSKASDHIIASGGVVKSSTRIDINVVNGLNNIVQESESTLVLLGWHGPGNTADRLFGTKLDQFLRKCKKIIFVSNTVYNLNTTKRICIIMPRFAAEEASFKQWLFTILNLAKSLGATLVFHCAQESVKKIEAKVEKWRGSLDFEFSTYDNNLNVVEIYQFIKADDLLILVNARPESISHEFYMNRMTEFANRHLLNRNFIFVYPSQL